MTRPEADATTRTTPRRRTQRHGRNKDITRTERRTGRHWDDTGNGGRDDEARGTPRLHRDAGTTPGTMDATTRRLGQHRDAGMPGRHGNNRRDNATQWDAWDDIGTPGRRDDTGNNGRDNAMLGTTSEQRMRQHDAVGRLGRHQDMPGCRDDTGNNRCDNATQWDTWDDIGTPGRRDAGTTPETTDVTTRRSGTLGTTLGRRDAGTTPGTMDATTRRSGMLGTTLGRQNDTKNSGRDDATDRDLGMTLGRQDDTGTAGMVGTT